MMAEQRRALRTTLIRIATEFAEAIADAIDASAEAAESRVPNRSEVMPRELRRANATLRELRRASAALRESVPTLVANQSTEYATTKGDRRCTRRGKT